MHSYHGQFFGAILEEKVNISLSDLELEIKFEFSKIFGAFGTWKCEMELQTWAKIEFFGCEWPLSTLTSE